MECRERVEEKRGREKERGLQLGVQLSGILLLLLLLTSSLPLLESRGGWQCGNCTEVAGSVQGSGVHQE